MSSLVPNQTNLNVASIFPALGGGGGSGSIYPIVSTIGLDPVFVSTGQLIMNVATTSQPVNVTQPFDVQENHAYGFFWKASWFVSSGTYATTAASLRGNLSPLGGVSGSFYGPTLAQTTANTDDGDYVNINTSFVNNVNSAQSVQFYLQTVDYPYGSTNPSNFSSIVQQVVNSPPILVDFGPAS